MAPTTADGLPTEPVSPVPATASAAVPPTPIPSTAPPAPVRDGSQLRGRERETFVAGMFDRIASAYDSLNRVISFGQDLRWRRIALQRAGVPVGGAAVDLGTGTGDFFILLREAVGAAGTVTGIDIAAGMLEIARTKAAQAFPDGSHDLRLGGADRTDLPAGFADVVTMGWVLRNVGDRQAVYREVLRILKPGGKFVCLDMSQSDFAPLRWGASAYLNLVMPIVVRLIGGDRSAYEYLAKSTASFPRKRELAREWEAAGFARVEVGSFMLGGIGLHIGVKPTA